MVAYAYAAQYPAEVGKVVLMDAFLPVATNVSGTVVQGSGHWLMEEAPDQVIAAIVTFLNNE